LRINAVFGGSGQDCLLSGWNEKPNNPEKNMVFVPACGWGCAGTANSLIPRNLPAMAGVPT
jgi:hypothetical protein